MSKKDKTQINKPLSENMNDRIDVDMERLRKNHVMVATPCYGGMVGEPYLKAMTGLSILFKHYGLNFTLATLSNESLVTRARNTLMAMFLQNPSYTHLLFIDADMIPKNATFLKKYLDFALTQTQVVFGGYAYEKDGNNKNLLRYKYGIKREEKKAAIRTKRPFKNIYSGNVLIKKEIFLKTNLVNDNRYGLDCVFSASMKNLKINPIHIDNETYHKGIESNMVFLKKAREGAKTISWLYENSQITHQDNRLVHVFKLIEKWRLLGFFKRIGKLLIILVEKLLIKNRAPMIFLDFYRLYHFSVA